MRFFLDAGVPRNVGEFLRAEGHTVIFHQDALPDESPDDQVCAIALLNDAVLVAVDRDMKRAARRFGRKLSEDRFKRLNLVLLVCSEVQAVNRLKQSMTLLELEWDYALGKEPRRLWVEIGPHHIRTNR